MLRVKISLPMTVYEGVCIINITLMIQRCLLWCCVRTASQVLEGFGHALCILFFFCWQVYTQMHCIWNRVCLLKDLEYAFTHLNITIKVEIEAVHMFSFKEIPNFFFLHFRNIWLVESVQTWYWHLSCDLITHGHCPGFRAKRPQEAQRTHLRPGCWDHIWRWSRSDVLHVCPLLTAKVSSRC